MTFQQLTYVVEVARCASINKAAERLYTHQSNVSSVLRQLEDELGIQIFRRSHKGVSLTDAGREFLAHAQELVEKKAFLESLYAVRGQRQPLRFQVSSMRSFFAYAPLLELSGQGKLPPAPLSLRLRKCTLKEVLSDVANGADLGIIFTMKAQRTRLPQMARMKNVECIPLGESRLHAVVREGHPLLKDRNLDRIGEYPYVIIENRENLGLLYDEESRSGRGLFEDVPRQIISTNDSMTCQSIVAETNAFFISTTPWRHSEHYHFASIPLPGEANILTVYGVVRRGGQLSQTVDFYIFITRNQMLVLVLGHQFQKPGPLVFYPHGVEILEVRAKHQHNLGGVQRGEDVRLVLRSRFILQGDTREERPVAFFGQGIIHILGDNTVDGTTPALVCLFVADEDVVGFLFAGDFQYTFADILNGLGLVPVEPSGNGVSVLAGLIKVGIRQDAVEGGAMASGNLLPRSRVIYVFNTIPAKHPPQ